MNKTALIIVDMIYDFTNPKGKVFYPKNEEIIADLKNFINIARLNDCLVIFVEHTVKKTDFLEAKLKMRECCIEGSGGEITDDRLDCNRKKDIIIKKTKYSSFYRTNLDKVLETHKIENLLIAGTKTNNCIIATTFDAFYRDYNTYVVSDLVGTNDTLTNAIYLRDIKKYLAKTMSSQDITELLTKGEL
jgi:nicotinamidase-related amidase